MSETCANKKKMNRSIRNGKRSDSRRTETEHLCQNIRIYSQVRTDQDEEESRRKSENLHEILIIEEHLEIDNFNELTGIYDKGEIPEDLPGELSNNGRIIAKTIARSSS